jgi:hypothetical protein
MSIEIPSAPFANWKSGLNWVVALQKPLLTKGVRVISGDIKPVL